VQLRLVDEVVQPARSVQQRVLRVQVEVDELAVGHGVVSKLSIANCELRIAD
jgi:hypothetical protein